MDLGQLLHLFVSDTTVRVVAALVAVDFVLGVSAAVKDGTFSFGYLHGFLIDDVLSKLVPWFAVYAASKAGLSDSMFAGLRDAIFAAVTAAMTASILKSLADLGLANLPSALTKEKKIG
jgi:Bacteriophage holin family